VAVWLNEVQPTRTKTIRSNHIAPRRYRDKQRRMEGRGQLPARDDCRHSALEKAREHVIAPLCPANRLDDRLAAPKQW